MSYNPNYGGHGYGGQYTGGGSGYGPPSSPPRGYGGPPSGSPPRGYGGPPSGSPPRGYGPPSVPPPRGYGPPPGPPPGEYGPQAPSYADLGRFVSPGDYVMPPGADPQLWDWFTKADFDHSGFINHMGLEFALINIGDWTPFDLDTIRLLMTMFDNDRDGRINFNEFAALWRYVKDSQKTFKRFDRDGSRSIDSAELGDALSQFGPGYHLRSRVIMLLQKKYAPNVANSPHGIPFDRFVRVCVVVKQLYDSFSSLDTDHDGLIHITQDKFLETVLSLP